MPVFEFPDVQKESDSSFRFEIVDVRHVKENQYQAIGKSGTKKYRIPFIKNGDVIELNDLKNALSIQYSFYVAMLLDETKNAFLQIFFSPAVPNDASIHTIRRSVVSSRLFRSVSAPEVKERLSHLECILDYIATFCRESNSELAAQINWVRENILSALRDEEKWTADLLNDLVFIPGRQLETVRNRIIGDSPENNAWRAVMSKLITAWRNKKPIDRNELLADIKGNAGKRPL